MKRRSAARNPGNKECQPSKPRQGAIDYINQMNGISPLLLLKCAGKFITITDTGSGASPNDPLIDFD
jgi:hypothetical protein